VDLLVVALALLLVALTWGLIALCDRVKT